MKRIFLLTVIVCAALLWGCGHATIPEGTGLDTYDGKFLGMEYRVFAHEEERVVYDYAFQNGYFIYHIDGDTLTVEFNADGMGSAVLDIKDSRRAESGGYSLMVLPDEMIRLRYAVYTDNGYSGWVIYHYLPDH